MKFLNQTMILIAVVFLNGCAYTATIKDSGDVYRGSQNPNAPRIALADLRDDRGDKASIGQISALALKSNQPINTILTNRIAGRLKDEGFSVQKVELVDESDKGQVAKASEEAKAPILLAGHLDSFFVSSADAVMQKATGRSMYFLEIFDKDGNKIFGKPYSGIAEYYIGLTGQFGSEKAIEMTMQASVDELFKDEEFKAFLKKYHR